MAAEGQDIAEIIAKQLLSSQEITPKTCLRALRRAYRYGAIRKLTKMEIAFLKAAANTRITYYQNPKIKEKLSEIIVKIELQTSRGQALIIGIRRALSLNKRILSLSFVELLYWLKKKLNYILYLARSLTAVTFYFKPWI